MLKPPIERTEVVKGSRIVHADIVQGHGKLRMRVDALQVLKLSTLRPVPDTKAPAQSMRVYLLFAADSIAIVTAEALVNGGSVAREYPSIGRYLLQLDVGQQPQSQVSVKGQNLELATLAPNPDRVVAIYAYVLRLDGIYVHRSQRQSFAYPQSEMPDCREQQFVQLLGFLRYDFVESVVRYVVAIHLFHGGRCSEAWDIGHPSSEKHLTQY